MSVTRSWKGVGAVGGWQVVASSTYYSVFAATASVSAEFGMSSYQIGILLAVLTLGYTLMLFPAGAIVDGYGDRVTMVLGLGLLSAGAFTVSRAPSYEVLLLAAFVLGASYSSAMPATNRAIASRAPRGRYNLAIGVKQVGVTTGSAIASIAVTNATRVGGTWRTAFLVISAISGVVAVGYLVGYRGVGGTGTMEFPDLRGLRANRTYILLIAAGFFIGSGIFTTTGYLVPYLETAGSTVELAGFALAAMQVSGSAGRIGVGELADRLPGSAAAGAFRMMLAQMGTAAALYIALPMAGVSVQFVLVAILGVSILGVTGLYHGTLVRLVPADSTGAATAGGQTMLNLGGLIAPPVFGLVVDATGFYVGWRLLALGSFFAVVFLTLAIRSTEKV